MDLTYRRPRSQGRAKWERGESFPAQNDARHTMVECMRGTRAATNEWMDFVIAWSYSITDRHAENLVVGNQRLEDDQLKRGYSLPHCSSA